MSTLTTTEIEALLAAFDAEYRSAWTNLIASRDARTPVRTGWGGELIANQVSYGKVDVELVLAGLATPIEIVATEDGQVAWTQVWHQGPTTGSSIYVERWTPAGRTFHGYVDPTSRQVVQTG